MKRERRSSLADEPKTYALSQHPLGTAIMTAKPAKPGAPTEFSRSVKSISGNGERSGPARNRWFVSTIVITPGAQEGACFVGRLSSVAGPVKPHPR